MLESTLFPLDAENGEYSITYSAAAKSKNEGEAETSVSMAVVGSTITVTDLLRGDFNGDFVVDSDDAIYLLRHVLFGSKFPLN